MRENEPQDALAARTFTPLAAPTPVDPQAEAQAAQAEQAAEEALQALKRNAAALIMGGLKLLRGAIAKRLPEIMDEWPDELLEAPAKAAVPLIESRLDQLMSVVKADPKVVVFALACAPLGLGYIVAVNKHSNTIDMPTGDGAAGPS